MFFSIVIPTHQRLSLLKELLHSLESQSFKSFEVLVIATEADPAFKLQDSSWNFPIQFLYIPNDPNNGKSASAKRNYGAYQASAPWIAFTDDDCVADPKWLEEAQKTISNNDVHFVEGAVNIPKPNTNTFTYKGIKRLSRSGGYQTCNMFYNKEIFIKLGGFDKNFPYYLEDTDMAWTFLDDNKKVLFAEKAVISHPVPPAAPHKMLESAWRMEKLPYLMKKHHHLFKTSSFRALPRAYALLLLFDISAALAFFFTFNLAALLLTVRLTLTLFVLLKMLQGCVWTWDEFIKMYYYLIICPLISLLALMKGNYHNRVWLFLR